MKDVALLHGIIEALPSQPPASGLDHLVIVPGHCIWTGAHAEDPENEDSWLLASYQRGCGHPSIFRAHISRGTPRQVLLVFSGGYTSPLSATSEGAAYLRFARATGLLPSADRFMRAATEDVSLGLIPKPRFEQLHRRALRWPKLHFTYVGIPLGTEADERQALTNAFTPYSTDMYGCHAPLVQMVQKRAGRNFHAKAHGYHVGAPEMHELLEWSEGWHADLSWYASLRISSEPGEI
ncbi:hypothetical protein EDB85DRAFT_2148628 [Lactarius pseudohatsudake]|nr:hypothetical protein EDB85DRAFT_2148628 [Lactarius pseudohatsudake]